MKVFVDTSAFYALASLADEFHRDAVSIYKRLLQQCRLVTTSYVIVETVALLQSRGGHSVACSFMKSLSEGDAVEVIWVSENAHQQGCQLFLTKGVAMSLVDCVSIVVMRHWGIGRFSVLISILLSKGLPGPDDLLLVLIRSSIKEQPPCQILGPSLVVRDGHVLVSSVVSS